MPIIAVLYKQGVKLPTSVIERKRTEVEEGSVGVTVFIIWREKLKHSVQSPKLGRHEPGARFEA